MPWEHRADRTRECIAVMKTLWCDEVASFKGDFYDVPECLQNTKPVQNPHPPLYFGGESEPALRRVAELGQGWFGYNLTPDQVDANLKQLDLRLAKVGRSRSDVKIQVSPRGHYVSGHSKPLFQRCRKAAIVSVFEKVTEEQDEAGIQRQKILQQTSVAGIN